MISFRFHVVSITAVFLAIAIGVVVGSTYVDRAIVDNLQSRIDSVSANLDDRKAENDALEERLNDASASITAGADFAVTGRLTDVPVLIVAARGIDEAAVEDTARLARVAGGVVPGVVWLEPKWSLADDADRAALEALVGASDGAEPDQLWDDAWEAVAGELAIVRDVSAPSPVGPELGAATTTTAPPEDPEAPMLLGLADAGFLTLDQPDDDTVDLSALAGSGALVVVVVGSDADDQLLPLVPVVVAATLEGGSVVADVFVSHTDGPERGQALTDAFDEEALAAMAIVDNADLVEGRVAVVLALAGVPDLVGQFGYGPDADAVLPAWSPP